MQSQSLPRPGQWAGFYNAGDDATSRHRLELFVRCDGETLSGVGQDETGLFVLRGSYDALHLECHGELTCSSGHHFRFQGYSDDDGVWGTWQGGRSLHGGFRLAPLPEPQPAVIAGNPDTLTKTLP